MLYSLVAIPEAEIPRAANPLFQQLLDTYASETNKVISVWRCFDPTDLSFRPHPRSSTVADSLKHQLLSERRFFGEFIGAPETAGVRSPSGIAGTQCLHQPDGPTGSAQT